MPPTDNEPGQPDPGAAVQAQLDAVNRAAAHMLETLAPAVAQAVQSIQPVLVSMSEALDRIGKEVEVIGRHLATSNRRDRTR